MAKRRRPCGSKKIWQTRLTPQPVHIRPPRHERNSLVHSIPSPPSSPPTHVTLQDRFQALPPELRAYIFSLLLVQPVKWDLEHISPCPLLRQHYHEDAVSDDYLGYSCARCDDDSRVAEWRLKRGPVLMHPWRSKYAPEVGNPYNCSDCWDRYFRDLPGPTRRGLRCICARRQNLDVLLVCRQWNQEAAPIFWSQNTFAFEDCSNFVDFVDNVSPTCKDRITRVSIMTRLPHDSHGQPNTSRVYMTRWTSRMKVDDVWSRLRALPAVSLLELDAGFLQKLQSSRTIFRTGLRNVRQVRFTFRLPPNTFNLHGGSWYIWPEYRQSFLLVGGLAEDFASAIKGKRIPWMKNSSLLKAAEQREKLKGERMNLLIRKEWDKMLEWDWIPKTGEEYRDEIDEDYGGVFDSTHPLRRGHWRSWNRTLVGTLELEAAEHEQAAAKVGVDGEETEDEEDFDISDPFLRMLRL